MAEESRESVQRQQYSHEQTNALLSFYEGELQARDALLDLLQRQTQGSISSHQSTSSSSTTASSTQRDPLETLIRDSQLVAATTESDHNNECSLCGGALLYSANMVQMQRDCNRKVNKTLALIGKRYSNIQNELELKEQRMKSMVHENERYVKALETERDQLLEQLKQCQIELSRSDELRMDMEQALYDERGRTKQMVVHLLEERRRLLSEMQGMRKVMAESASAVGSLTVSSNTTGEEQIRRLKEENVRLNAAAVLLQSDKTGLQKRLDYLLRDLQQNAFHQHFQFLQPKITPSCGGKELIGDGLMSPGALDQKGRLRNSSSFPLSFGGDSPEKGPKRNRMAENDGGRRERAKQQLQIRDAGWAQNSTAGPATSGGVIVPLVASTTIGRRPPPVPRSVATAPHQYRRHPTMGTAEQQWRGAAERPQGIVITRRSTSLPRRTASVAGEK